MGVSSVLSVLYPADASLLANSVGKKPRALRSLNQSSALHAGSAPRCLVTSQDSPGSPTRQRPLKVEFLLA